MAELQGFFMLFKDSATDAVDAAPVLGQRLRIQQQKAVAAPPAADPAPSAGAPKGAGAAAPATPVPKR